MTPRFDRLFVHVDLNGRTLQAGTAFLTRGRGGLTGATFEYERGYLDHLDAYELDPQLPLVTGSQYISGGLPGALSDSAPDRWGRNLIRKRDRLLALEAGRTAATLDDADFLVGVSDATRQGALRIKISNVEGFVDPGHEVPRLLQLPELLHAANDAASERGDEGIEAIKLLLDAGSGSLGGARPKASVRGDDGELLIAKFPHREDGWDVMAWEKTALDLSAAVGIAVPPSRLTQIGDCSVLILKRFDRNANGARIGYISAMTLVEARDGDHGDYVDIAESISARGSASATDLRELFRRAILNVAIHNTDDHLRNHGFIRADGGWRLSPAFDVNPNPDAGSRQTSIAGAFDRADEVDGLLALASSCGLSPDAALSEIGATLDGVRGWRSVASANGIPDTGIRRFAGILDERIAALEAVSDRARTTRVEPETCASGAEQPRAPRGQPTGGQFTTRRRNGQGVGLG